MAKEGVDLHAVHAAAYTRGEGTHYTQEPWDTTEYYTLDIEMYYIKLC